MKNLKNINNLLESFNIKINQLEKWHDYKITYKNEETDFVWKESKTNLYDAIDSFIKEHKTIEVNNVVAISHSKPVSFSNSTQKQSAKKLHIVKEREELSADYDSYPDLPSVIEGFYMPDFKDSLVRRIRYKRNVLIVGPAGSGKSEMIQKVSSVYGINCIRINFSNGISESDLLGKFIVKNGETKFVDGYIPLAMKNGWWVILDEIDYAQPENIACLQAVLEGNDLVNIKNEGEIVKPHPRTRFFATANTKGRGDVTDSYNGTNFLNIAFLDRWTILEMDYTKKEKDIAKSILGDDILSNKIMDLFTLLRRSVKNGDIMNAAFSTRRLIQLCEALKMGDSLADSIQYEILTRYHEDEVSMISEYVSDVFFTDHYIKKSWKLGDPHFVAKTADVSAEVKEQN